MARPRKAATLPEWFALPRYADTGGMDAAGWYFNLAARAAVTHDTESARVLTAYIRGVAPLLRRAEIAPLAPALAGMPEDFLALLRNRAPHGGAAPLRADELYFFERRLPENIRKFGAQFVPGESPARDAPKGFGGPLDELFSPRLLGAIVRIDLSLPDEVVLDGMREFLRRQRRAHAAIGGRQPCAEALRELRGRKSAKFRTFSRIGLLPLIDLMQWQRESGVVNPPGATARALGITLDDLHQARRYSAILLNPFALRGWLLSAARKAIAA